MNKSRRRDDIMAMRKKAPVSAILFSLLLVTTLTEAAVAAPPVNYAMTFYGPWVSTTKYQPGYVFTYNGASYLCLVANFGNNPASITTDWAILDAPGAHGDPL